MAMLSTIASAALAALHVYIMALEMVFWTTPRGLKAFNLKKDFAEKTKSLAANQGLYNGFLAAGLVWGIFHVDPVFARQIELFFLGCIEVAGLYGGLTTNKKILYVQASPAALALLVVWAGL